jgi:hypothetical protein
MSQREIALAESDNIRWAIDLFHPETSDCWVLSVEALISFDADTDCTFGITSEYETEPSRIHAEMHKEDILQIIDESGVFDDVDLSVEQ